MLVDPVGCTIHLCVYCTLHVRGHPTFRSRPSGVRYGSSGNNPDSDERHLLDCLRLCASTQLHLPRYLPLCSTPHPWGLEARPCGTGLLHFPPKPVVCASYAVLLSGLRSTS